MNKSVYAELTTNCNLSCPHCDVKSNHDGWNKEKFMQQLLDFDGRIVLFGGEATLYEDRLFEVTDNRHIFKKVSTISTNLIKLNDRIISLFRDIGSVGTSWNPNRFNEDEYKIWLNNIDWLEDECIKVCCLITMTDDLVELGADKFVEIMSTWNNRVITSVKLEHYIGPGTDENYFNKVDEWLCDLHHKWSVPIDNEIINRIQHGWYYDCDGIYTLSPDGCLSHRCVHNKLPMVPPECYTCERVNECKPCRLQPHCSYPKKFAKLILDQ